MLMMTIGGVAHIIMVVVSILIVACLMFVVAHVSYKWQCVIIYSAVFVCMLGIAFLHLTHYGTQFDFKNFFTQMFQVCNFNFILLPLCLIKKNELGRQYLFYFSMPCALSTFVTYVSDVENSMWYSIVTLNFWIDHLLVVAVPLMMIAARWFKPQKKYIPWICLCILIYFGCCFIANFALNGWQTSGPHNHSYTMSSGGILVLVPLFKLIPIPFVYLLPMLPICALLFYLISIPFKNYKTIDLLNPPKSNKNKEKQCFT